MTAEIQETLESASSPAEPCPGLRPEAAGPPTDLLALNECLETLSAERFVAWSAETFGEGLVLSTSFGIQSAALLHLATEQAPKIPVVWVDTGYLPAETYRFAESLAKRLDLNLHVAQAEVSPARMEALHGRLWEEGTPEALAEYHRIRKVEPMQRALAELGATAWMSGIRGQQTEHRAELPLLGRQGGRYKVSPLLRWSTRDVHAYLKRHDLPYHPLFDEGYATVGDWHSSRPVTADDADERDTRFGGVAAECGLHLEASEDESLVSSAL